jgi:clan AA aspartic protease
MITGKIVNNQEAIIELEVTGVVHPETIEAIIDTGFTEELMLPGDLIERLGLPRIGELPITLGDGNVTDVGLYLAIVEWQGEKRIAQALRTDGKPLIGMSLLYGNRLTLDVVTDGEVTIETLS